MNFAPSSMTQTRLGGQASALDPDSYPAARDIRTKFRIPDAAVGPGSHSHLVSSKTHVSEGRLSTACEDVLKRRQCLSRGRVAFTFPPEAWLGQ